MQYVTRFLIAAHWAALGTTLFAIAAIAAMWFDGYREYQDYAEPLAFTWVFLALVIVVRYIASGSLALFPWSKPPAERSVVGRG